ncbi:MAG: phosphate ABC transporter substrate-binding protein [Stappia sp.]|uniref:phosphate/phosphite/phosphonate ABC transporter substrate-binding protein n=1 Tax=Stappia sp. TaxID=1870903 RepID=UPI000C3C4F43|nr:PhnD/SsuA/transferrin family substrate-binding protein [Stappia sp.]MAB00579.1 phosphate ABC transporter substrate-binding protein [Stappia sp.]MBM18649.1 phosphate ABC transporter substrate-binding protein [Stappia sp.]
MSSGNTVGTASAAHGAPVAGLPMYDWPELRDLNDRWWSVLRDALREEGFAAPAALARALSLEDLWLHPGLLVGQTCGLPYVRHLQGRVDLLGAPAYRLSGCRPGHYCSVVVVRADDDVGELCGLRGRRLAFNHPGSQSGEGALRHMVAPLAGGAPFFSQVLATGSHRAALRAVADGAADAAAIDAVSFELARLHEPATGKLRVLVRTPETPGLPLITASRPPREVEKLRNAVALSIGQLDAGTRAGLLLEGFVPFTPDDYRVISGRDAGAAALGYPDLA